MKDWFVIARRKDIVTRAGKVSGIVGTILIGINQGDVILSGAVTPSIAAIIALTYCVPYAVSTYASAEAIRATK